MDPFDTTNSRNTKQTQPKKIRTTRRSNFDFEKNLMNTVTIEEMSVGDVRQCFHQLRSAKDSLESSMTLWCGCTAGQFALKYLLYTTSNSAKRRKKKHAENIKSLSMSEPNLKLLNENPSFENVENHDDDEVDELIFQGLLDFQEECIQKNMKSSESCSINCKDLVEKEQSP